jgi:hypothetical protein
LTLRYARFKFSGRVTSSIRRSVKLFFYSCASVFDVTPLAMDRDPCPSHNPGATPLAYFPLN